VSDSGPAMPLLHLTETSCATAIKDVQVNGRPRTWYFDTGFAQVCTESCVCSHVGDAEARSGNNSRVSPGSVRGAALPDGSTAHEDGAACRA
jgi:hypothetical protein